MSYISRLRPSGFSSPFYVENMAALQALRARPSLVLVGGFYTPGDDGGGVFDWNAGSVATTYAGLVVSPTSGAPGRYIRQIGNFISARWVGAKGDAVFNAAGTPQWTGTDDTASLQLWEAAGKAFAKDRYLPPGNYIVNDKITAPDLLGMQTNSNGARIYGDGKTSVLVNRIPSTGTGGMYRYTGIMDAISTAQPNPNPPPDFFPPLPPPVQLAVPAAAGDKVITVNDGSLMSPGQFFYLTDFSQLVLDYSDNSTIARVGEVCRVADIVGNDVQLSGALEFSYAAYVGPGITTGTTIRRFTAPLENITVENLCVAFDSTVTYANTFDCFFFRRGRNVTTRNLSFIEGRMSGVTMQDIINYTDENFYWEQYGDRGNQTYPYQASTSHFGLRLGIQQIGGRHVTEGSAVSTDSIMSSYCEIIGARSEFSHASAYQHHYGVRDWIYDGCIANNGGAGPFTDQAGFMPRGQNITIKNCKVNGFPYGVFATNGRDVTIQNTDIKSVRIGILQNFSPNLRAENIHIEDARETGVYMTLPNVANRAINVVRLQNIEIEGAVPVAIHVEGTTLADRTAWQGIYAPDAVLDFDGGTAIGGMSLNATSATMTKTISASQNDYGPVGLFQCDQLWLDGGAADRDVTGLTTGSKGRTMLIRNNGTTNNIVLKNLSGSSAAANQFSFPGGTDITLAPLEAVLVEYDTVSLKWLKA